MRLCAPIVAVTLALCFLASGWAARAERPLYPPLPAQGMAALWQVHSLDGTTQRMRLEVEFGLVDRIITLVVSARLVPTSGEVRYTNGEERSLTAGEIRYFWTGVGGAQAAWQHAQREGHLRLLDRHSPELAERWQDRWVAIVTRDQRWFIGMPMASGSYDVKLAIDDMGLPGEPRRPLLSIARTQIDAIWGLD